MNSAQFRFYAELNDFLPAHRRAREFACETDGRQSVKHLIEAFGVPHTEVDLILVNGESVGFGYLVQDGDRVSVYPVFEAFDITPLSQVRPIPLRQTRFAADVHLGHLTAYLRMAGFNTVCEPGWDDGELAASAAREHRIVLTRDRDLLKRRSVTHGYFVRGTSPRLQLLEVLRRFDLARSLAPFSRCMRCNGELEDVTREAVEDQVPLQSRRHAGQFRRCRRCAQVYWDGSHYRRMSLFIAQIKREMETWSSST